MEWKLKKELCPYCCTILEQKQMQEQTQEVRLADAMPDIGRVLACRGQMLIRGKEWHSDQVGMNGGVMVKVLYVPEDGSEVRSVDCWIPVQMKWDLDQGQPEGILHLQSVLRGVDARALSTRKLMVRCTVGVLAKAMVNREAELYTYQMPEEDIQLRMQTYPLMVARESGEKTFSLDEELTAPEGMAGVRKLLCATVEPEISECKVLAGRLVFRGDANVHILYADGDGQVSCMDYPVGFSQYAQLDLDHSQHAQADMDIQLTTMEMEVDPEGRVRMQCGMTAQYMVRDRVMLETVTDAYSLRRSVEQTTQMLQMPVCLDTIRREIPVSKTVPSGAKSVVDITWHWDIAGGVRHSDGTQMELQGVFDVLYVDENGALQGHTARFEDSFLLPTAPENHVCVKPIWQANPQGKVTEDGLTMGAMAALDIAVEADAGVNMVTQLKLGPVQPADPARPSLILLRSCTDSLWDIAKECGSTVEAIRQANHLEGEPAPDSFVLVPVC